MRYFYIDGTYLPKNSLWGPRFKEGLILKQSEWQRINDHLSVTEYPLGSANATPDLQEYKKMMSRSMTSTWDNTLAKVKSLDQQKKLQEMEEEKQAKIDEYHKIINSQKMEMEKILNNAQELVYHSKDTTKQLSSGWMHSAIVHERNNQAEFHRQLERRMQEKLLNEARQMKEDAVRTKKEEVDEKEKEWQKKLNFRHDLDLQIAELMRNKEEDLLEVEREKVDLVNIKLELKEFADREKQVADDAREYLKKDIESFNQSEKLIKEARRRESEEDDKINQIYIDVANCLDEERRKREKKIIRDAYKARLDYAHKNMPRQVPRKLDEMIEAERVLAEEEEMKKLQERKEQKEKLLQDLLAAMADAEKEIEERQRREQEEQKWEVVHKEKLNELNEIWMKKEREREIARILSVREGYMKQWVENNEKRAKEREEELMVLEDLEKDKEELLKYCDQVLKATTDLKRPTYPIIKAIEKVKKQTGIRETGKYVPFLQSNVPIESVAHYERARKKRSQSIRIRK